jgi:ribosomal protein L11
MSKVLSQADLDKLMGEVDGLTEDELKALALQAAKDAEVQKERRKKYQATKSPEAVAKQRAYQKLNSAKKRARNKIILAKAKEMGIEVPQS